MHNIKGSLPYFVNNAVEKSTKEGVTYEYLWYVLRNAIDPKLLISNVAEALRISEHETEKLLEEYGFEDLVAQKHIKHQLYTDSSEKLIEYTICQRQDRISSFVDELHVEFYPGAEKKIKINPSLHKAITSISKNITISAKSDTFLSLYRKNIISYHDNFLKHDSKLIDQYIKESFDNHYPEFLINSGIGANEQFNHFVSSLNNDNPNRKLKWIIIDSPRHLADLPKEISIENSLFMEFSRSGKTEETVKIHEYTPRNAKRVVFANSGPLRELGIRDKNLVLDLPDHVSGRFGRNKTPILLAPMHVAKMDTKFFWKIIDESLLEFDLEDENNLPLTIAKFIYLYQKMNNCNHIYLGCNDKYLSHSADEFLQFWNEGVNKDGNDLSMSRYFGLLRDSHLNIEGLLANHKNKLAIFLIREKMCPEVLPPLVQREIDSINPEHSGLFFGEEEQILMEANCQRFAELMPTIKITVLGDINLKHSAILGQLWSDITYCYSRLVNVDPGSNPEVKFVRDRAAKLLSEFALKKTKLF